MSAAKPCSLVMLQHTRGCVIRLLRTAASAACVLLCLLALVKRTEARSSASDKGEVAAAQASSGFAIADFDGDRKPDLATVQVEPVGTRGDKLYSIRFKLTSGEAQVFGVTAPAGGLQIVARDVNGDNALDLLVSTPWQHKAIAVLLNDGHGNFTLAEPASFPAVSRQNETQWKCGTISFCEGGVLVRCENATGEFKEKNECQGVPREVGLDPSGDSGAPTNLSLFSLLGRAPPV